METIVDPVGTRQVARDAVRAHVTAVAIELFDQHGFDAVTVEQIATAAGISARSFHRYFAAKEDTVVGDVTRWTRVVAEGFASRPPGESIWESLFETYRSMLAGGHSSSELGRRVVRVSLSTPSLRARNLEKHLDWARALTPLVRARMRGADADVRAAALVQASVACFDVALAAWAGDTRDSPVERALRAAFRALAPAEDARS